MQETAVAPGSIILTIAIAAGWVALALMLLRLLLSGFKLISSRFLETDESKAKSDFNLEKENKGF